MTSTVVLWTMKIAWQPSISLLTHFGAFTLFIFLMASAVQLQHSVFIGATRYGKSAALFATNADRLTNRNRPAYVVLDPHGPLTKNFGVAAVYHRIPLIYDYLNETANVPGYNVLTNSTNPDPDQRIAENRLSISEAQSLLLRSRGMIDTTKTPIIDECTNAALNLYLAQHYPVPFYILRDCFFHASDAHAYLKAHCTDPRWSLQFDIYGGLRGPQYEFKCGPGERILREICDSPQFQKRCVPTFDLAAHLNAGGIICMDGESKGNLSRQDSALIMGNLLLNVIRLARSGELTRRVVIVIDEGQSSHLVDLQVARALKESAKWGLEWQIAIHSPFFDIPEIQTTIAQCCAKQFWFKQVDHGSARFAAETCGIAKLDPMKVHSVERRTRLEHDGYDIEEVISEGEWKSGDQHGTSINKNIVARQRYREKVEEFTKYMTLNEQLLMHQKEVTELGVGYAIIRSDTSVSPTGIYIPMRRFIWDDMLFSRNPKITLAEHKLAQHIALLKTTPAYQTRPKYEPWKNAKAAAPKRGKRGME